MFSLNHLAGDYIKSKGDEWSVSLLLYLNEGLEALVFGHQVLVEVDSFVVAAAEPFIHPLHGFSIGA